MDTENEWMERVLRLADANGWRVVEFNLRRPGFVLLEDRSGTTVQIGASVGTDIPYYVEQFKARPRERPVSLDV